MYQIAVKPPRASLIPKPRRLERRAVTIVAGFKCKEGVVLCADTQETIEHTKMRTPKLRFEPRELDCHDGENDLVTLFAGAGEGPFIDKLVERTWEDIQAASNFDNACTLAEQSIKNTYAEFGRVFQLGYCPSAELLFAIKMDGQSKLFRADGPLVNEKTEFANGGTGLYLSNFLCSRMYHPSLTLAQIVILAAYVLDQATEYLDGCGGEHHIGVLRNGGGSEFVDPITLKGIVNHLRKIDKEAFRIIFASANLELPEDTFKGLAEHLKIMLFATREAHQNELGMWPQIKKFFVENSEMHPSDFKPLEIRKSRDRQ